MDARDRVLAGLEPGDLPALGHRVEQGLRRRGVLAAGPRLAPSPVDADFQEVSGIQAELNLEEVLASARFRTFLDHSQEARRPAARSHARKSVQASCGCSPTNCTRSRTSTHRVVASPAEAFTVQCGLGTTMTGLDILNGYMRVQVTLQMIRPAGIIELTFKQQMQGV